MDADRRLPRHGANYCCAFIPLDRWRPRHGAYYVCGACIHLLASAALLVVAYRYFGGQGAAWALGAIFLSCLAVPLVLRPQRPGIAAPGGGEQGRPAGDGIMELPPASKFERDVPAAEGWAQCSICLSIIRVGEMVRRMPVCKHLFHARCVDEWLRAHTTCPLCRAAVRRPEV